MLKPFQIYLILLCFALLIPLSFLYNNLRIMQIDNFSDVIDVGGRVLGVSEKNDDFIETDELLNKPLAPLETINKENKNPVLKEEATAVEIDDCAGVLLDKKSGKFLYSREADKQMPIASITKLVTAMVFLDNNPGWESEYQIRAGDRVEGGRIYLYQGEKVTVENLFYLSLVGSANTATRALVNASGLSTEDFIALMNEKVGELGLKNTFFFDPIGLSRLNVSTASEVAILTAAALEYPEIKKATGNKKYSFTTLGGKSKSVVNTDALLNAYPQEGIEILGGKTGYTKMAGYCFTGDFSDQNNNELISVILGGSSRQSRFSETKKLIKWAYENFRW